MTSCVMTPASIAAWIAANRSRIAPIVPHGQPTSPRDVDQRSGGATAQSNRCRGMITPASGFTDQANAVRPSVLPRRAIARCWAFLPLSGSPATPPAPISVPIGTPKRAHNAPILPSRPRTCPPGTPRRAGVFPLAAKKGPPPIGRRARLRSEDVVVVLEHLAEVAPVVDEAPAGDDWLHEINSRCGISSGVGSLRSSGSPPWGSRASPTPRHRTSSANTTSTGRVSHTGQR